MKLLALFEFATNSKANINAAGLPALGEGLAKKGVRGESCPGPRQWCKRVAESGHAELHRLSRQR